tara:strand:- start:212 stop:406 length:195 start_codon:yes stop_codon:yes gene_type:complete
MSKASRDDYTLLRAERLARDIYEADHVSAEMTDDMGLNLGLAAREAVSAIQELRYILSKMGGRR